MADLKVIPVETDVLVLGGGLAGCMAAIKAAENEGLKVTLVDKSDTRGSGAAGSGIDHVWAYIPEVHQPMGYTIDDMAEDHRLGTAQNGFRRDLFYLVAGTMYDRMLDLERFGINFRYADSKIPGHFRVVQQFHSVPTSFNFDGHNLKPVLTKQMRARGVNIINRVQTTDLIITDGQVSGAVGVNVRTADIYLFKAKSVVLACGRSNRLSRTSSGLDLYTREPTPLSGDGTSMAMRVGIPSVNMEYMGGRGLDAHAVKGAWGDPRNTVQPAARIIDGDGNVIVARTQFFDWDSLGKWKWSPEIRQKWLKDKPLESKRSIKRMHGEGKGPFFLDLSEASEYEADYIEWSLVNEGKGTQLMRLFKDEEGLDLRKNAFEYAFLSDRRLGGDRGVWVDKDLETNIKNLFAAGDEVGAFVGQAAPGAIAQGWYAGEMAAKRADSQKSFLVTSEDLTQARKELCSKILNREVGFYWKEVELYVQNLMDFYCGDIRSEGLLKRGLERLEYARGAPFKAENAHELGRALDVMSIMDNTELVLRSSLERKESRRGFRRADYPERDDENWSCLLAIIKEDGEFKFSKYPLDS